MTTANSSTAIQTSGMGAIKALLFRDDVMARFQDVMGGRGAQAFINSVLLTVAEKPELQACTAESIMVQAMRAATIRLSVDKSARQAYMGTRVDKKTGNKVADLIIGWRGIRTMAERTGKFKNINVTAVFEGETVTVDRLRGMVTIGGKMTAPKVIGRVAYFLRHDGLEHAIYMTTKEIHDRAKELKPGAYNARDGFWQNPKFVGAMEAKDVLVILLRDWAELDPNDIAALEAASPSPVSAYGGEDDEVIDLSPTPDPSPFSKSENGEGGRVRTADEIRGWLHDKANELAKAGKRVASVQQRGLMTSVFDRCWDFEPNPSEKRLTVLKAITGFEGDVANQLPAVYALALLEWLKPEQVEGRWVPCAEAKAEARAVWGAESRRQNAEGSGG